MAVPMLTDDQLAALTREAALEYYTPEQLAVQLGLDPQVIARILNRPDVAPTVARIRRELTESGERFVLAAKQAATEALPEVLAIALDHTQSTADRLKAVESLAKWSGLARTEDDKGQISITIHGVDSIQKLRQDAPWAPRADIDAPSSAAAFKPLTVEFDVPDHVQPDAV